MTAVMHRKPFGVILAGGQATRMGGGDKALLPLGGRRILDHVLDRITPQVSDLALSANGDAARWDAFHLPVLPDTVPGFPGPLAGVLAGLDWAAEKGGEHIVTVAADTPFFPQDLVTRLQEAARANGSGLALAATIEGARTYRQPTFGLWPVALRHDLRAALADGLRKVVMWTDGHNAGQAVFETGVVDPFFNINTPQDLARAEGLL